MQIEAVYDGKSPDDSWSVIWKLEVLGDAIQLIAFLRRWEQEGFLLAISSSSP